MTGINLEPVTLHSKLIKLNVHLNLITMAVMLLFLVLLFTWLLFNAMVNVAVYAGIGGDGVYKNKSGSRRVYGARDAERGVRTRQAV